ncbi:MAG: tRNA (adenosine(37)-N6)-threonylcarbamoyltransferase complex dimerization subunit type 1 TsaB [Armatimonadota bacterium]
MNILTIETCTDTSTLGVVRDGDVLAEAAFPSRHTLVQRLVPRVEWLLGECGLARGDIEAIAISRGPGSFTGVRIGMTAAKTLALWGHIPLVGVSTLEALAYPFRALSGGLLVPLINARRQQAYLALFRATSGALQRLTPDLAQSAGAVTATVETHRAGAGPELFIGQLEGLPAGFLPPSAAVVRSLVTPHALAALGRERLERGETDDPVALAPIYLRNAAE